LFLKPLLTGISEKKNASRQIGGASEVFDSAAIQNLNQSEPPQFVAVCFAKGAQRIDRVAIHHLVQFSWSLVRRDVTVRDQTDHVVGTFNNRSRRNHAHHADQSVHIDQLRDFPEIRRLANKRIGISL
jgi:hypothetical protein